VILNSPHSYLSGSLNTPYLSLIPKMLMSYIQNSYTSMYSYGTLSAFPLFGIPAIVAIAGPVAWARAVDRIPIG
jgi:hypothetical protein